MNSTARDARARRGLPPDGRKRRAALERRAELGAATRREIEQTVHEASGPASRADRGRPPADRTGRRRTGRHHCRARARQESFLRTPVRRRACAPCSPPLVKTPRKRLVGLAVLALALWIAGAPAAVSAQPEPGHEPAAASASPHTEAPHEESIGKTVARLVNFAILVGALVCCCAPPLAGYLSSRGTQIRGDLVNAAGDEAGGRRADRGNRSEDEGAAGRAGGAAARRASRRSRRKKSGSQAAAAPPNAIACSSRRAARSICRSKSPSARS